MSTESDCVSFMQYENLFSFLVNFQVFVSPIFLLVFHSNSHLKIEAFQILIISLLYQPRIHM